jgi:hypothetical protein
MATYAETIAAGVIQNQRVGGAPLAKQKSKHKTVEILVVLKYTHFQHRLTCLNIGVLQIKLK